MVVACDTSFLFSHYGNDVHSPRALAWLRIIREVSEERAARLSSSSL